MDCQSFLLRLVILKASRKTTRHWLILNAFRYVTTIYYQASQPFLPLWQAWKVMFAQHTGSTAGNPRQLEESGIQDSCCSRKH